MMVRDNAGASPRESGHPGTEPPLVGVAGIDVGDVRLEHANEPSERLRLEVVELPSLHRAVDCRGREGDDRRRADRREVVEQPLARAAGQRLRVPGSEVDELVQAVDGDTERPDDQGSDDAAATGLVDARDASNARRVPPPGRTA